MLGDIAGAPGKLPYSKEVYAYMRQLEKATPRVTGKKTTPAVAAKKKAAPPSVKKQSLAAGGKATSSTTETKRAPVVKKVVEKKAAPSSPTASKPAGMQTGKMRPRSEGAARRIRLRIGTGTPQ